LLLFPAAPEAQTASDDGDVHVPAMAAGRGRAVTAAAAVRSSPFDPPTTDIFVSDSGAGLDTGCTFNTDTNHPLVISVVIDKFAGDVDGNGYLVNPAPLISAGIIPARVDIILPAFDIDYNGSPPPERDQILFNGQDLGLLTGDNNIWKLNTFSVDIQKIKFPARPPSGGVVTPATNKIQINVDTLSTGRWCMAVDWVGLVIPIKPKLAIDLSMVRGNKIRKNAGEDTIDTIYEQKFDAACKVTTSIGPVDEYPFSGTATDRATLRAKLKTCPENSIDPPEVKVDWTVNSGPSGSNNWTGFEGDVNVNMPDKVGAYGVDFSYTVNGKEKIDVSRKLFVTMAAPTRDVDPPRRSSYEKATAWASGQADENTALSALLQSMYGYGKSHWLYVDNKCSWYTMVNDPPSCSEANCYSYSDVFLSMAGTLGIGGFEPETVERGSASNGFLTKDASPSLDAAFKGNAKPLGSTAYDRYWFTSHSLRQRGTNFYDATFGKIYARSNAFIAFNQLSNDAKVDANGSYFETAEGAKIYKRDTFAYHNWPNVEYAPPPSPKSVLAARMQAVVAGGGLQFPGTANFRPLDANGDGISESLAADVDLDVLASGSYMLWGSLSKNGVTISSRRSNKSANSNDVSFLAEPGARKVTLLFSGEDIFASGEDGPYSLTVHATGVADAVLQTPAYDHRSFGEVPGSVVGVNAEAVDSDNDGKLDGIRADVDLNIRVAGDFVLGGSLVKDGKSLARADAAQAFAAGQQTVSILFPGLPLNRSGQDGPYQGSIALSVSEGSEYAQIGGRSFSTLAYRAGDFATVFEPSGAFAAQGVDTNGNGLYDQFKVSFDANFLHAGTYLLVSTLSDAAGIRFVSSERLVTVSPGAEKLSLDFSGSSIHGLELDGPYRVQVALDDPSTHKTVDHVALPWETAGFHYMDFDSGKAANAIALAGTSTDQGVDTDGDGIYNLLNVDVGVKLSQSGVYEWSGRLVDAQGVEIGFYTNRAYLSAGKTAIRFNFDGERIGKNGKDGPYFVKSLLIFGGGANLVATDVATTASYTASGFEGFTLANQPPVANAGPDRTAECTGQNGASFTLDGSGSSDPDYDPLTYTWIGPFGTATGPTPAVVCTPGTNTITLKVSDNKGATASDTVVVTVVDTTPPAIQSASATPSALWPPNHKMTPVTVAVSAADLCSASTTCKIVSVQSNEPVSGTEPGDMAPDWQITGNLTVNLRAERAGSGNGRVYTITVQCQDMAGNRSTKSVTVTVPHDQGS
jgi:hypothetical protein